MNFKLRFLCILFVNFLPQSFASPENSGSRRADEVLDKLEYLQAAVESLGKMVKEKGYVKSNEPRNKRQTPSTGEEAQTTSQSTTKGISEIPTTNLGTLSTSEVPTTLEMEVTTEQELETSTYSSTTLVPATKVSEATLQAGSSKLPGNSTTIAPSKKSDSIKLDEVLDKLENLQATVESLHKLIMEKSFLKSNEKTAAETGANSDSSNPKTPATISSKDKSTRKSTVISTSKAENVSQLSTAAGETELKSPSSKETTPKTISETPTTNLGTLSTSKVLVTNEMNLTRTMEPELETIFSNYSSATTNISEANSTTLALSKKNDSIKSEQESPPPRKAKSPDDGSLTNRSHFPTIFMVILVIVVVTYMIYHNRTKIHNFIKKHQSRDQESGPGYVKVKVDDDLDLPRDANRHYVY